MSVFIVLATAEIKEQVKVSVEQRFASNERFEVTETAWAIHDSAILPKEIFDKLELGQLGGIVVFPVEGYWGVHSRELWAWLAQKGKGA